MRTLPFEYRDKSHRIAQALAIAYVTQLRQMVFASDNVWTTSPKRLMIWSEPDLIVLDVVGTLPTITKPLFRTDNDSVSPMACELKKTGAVAGF